MSEIERLTAAIERLIISTDSLANRINSLNPSTAAPSSSSGPAVALDHPRPVTCVIELEELSRVPFPEQFQFETARTAHIGLENGPPEVPAFLLTKARDSLSNKPPGVESRVTSAYTAGHWAKVAIETQTPYEPRILSKGYRSVHWVVLRSTFESPFRTSSRRDLEIICDIQDPNLILETFASIFEVECFCLAARCSVPSLRSCSNRNWDLQGRERTCSFSSSPRQVNSCLMEPRPAALLFPSCLEMEAC